MSENSARSVTVERTGTSHFVDTNVRGGTISFGTGSDSEFTPVELLLAASAPTGPAGTCRGP